MKCKECGCEIFIDLTSVIDEDKVIQCFACHEQYHVSLTEFNNVVIIKKEI